MSRIAGVTTKKDEKGKITHVTIDVKKQPEALPILREMGLIEMTRFEKECANGTPIEEVKDRLLNHVRKVWKKKYG